MLVYLPNINCFGGHFEHMLKSLDTIKVILHWYYLLVSMLSEDMKLKVNVSLLCCQITEVYWKFRSILFWMTYI